MASKTVKQTSPGVAKMAGKILQDPSASAIQKTFAGSALR